MELRELSTLMGAYFHEDFDEVWPTLDQYLQDSTGADLARLISEIDSFLEEHGESPDQVSDRLRALGSCVHLGDHPGAHVAWLREIQARCRAHAGA